MIKLREAKVTTKELDRQKKASIEDIHEGRCNVNDNEVICTIILTGTDLQDLESSLRDLAERQDDFEDVKRSVELAQQLHSAYGLAWETSRHTVNMARGLDS